VTIDYTTSSNVIAYGAANGGLAGVSISPMEAAMIDTIVTAASRAIDVHCQQVFAQATYTDQRMRAQVTPEHMLQCWPSVPTMTTPTSASYRQLPNANWTTIDTSLIEVTESKSGCLLQVVADLGINRQWGELQIKASYTGGWTYSQLPSDFQYAVTSLCWWMYQKRSAPTEKSAIPEMGLLIIPGNWPNWVRDLLQPFVRVIV
jgi:hypothetical protein